MPWFFKYKKHYTGKDVENCGRLAIEAKSYKEANRKFHEIFMSWPEEDDESFYYLGSILYGPYDTKLKAKKEREKICLFF